MAKKDKKKPEEESESIFDICCENCSYRHKCSDRIKEMTERKLELLRKEFGKKKGEER